MKINELRENTKEELEAKLLDIKKNLFNLKFQKASGQLENPLRIRNLRKDIARIETLLREKETGKSSIGETQEKIKKEAKKKAIKK
jgi:large subunit ribosomal protein L29